MISFFLEGIVLIQLIVFWVFLITIINFAGQRYIPLIIF